MLYRQLFWLLLSSQESEWEVVYWWDSRRNNAVPFWFHKRNGSPEVLTAQTEPCVTHIRLNNIVTSEMIKGLSSHCVTAQIFIYYYFYMVALICTHHLGLRQTTDTITKSTIIGQRLEWHLFTMTPSMIGVGTGHLWQVDTSRWVSTQPDFTNNTALFWQLLRFCAHKKSKCPSVKLKMML